MEPLRVLSLFAGIGGFDLGLERTGGFKTVAVAEINPFGARVLAERFPGGFKTVAVAEINPFGARVLAERFPDAVNVGDVTTAEYPDADFIAAGFPCQDLSFAGAGAGLAGARSGLWREVVRAFRVVRPRGGLLENVAALLGRGMGTVLGDLAKIGYDAEWHCIPASAVGAPHRRDRVWIVADTRSEQHEGGRAPISGEIATELARAFADPDCERAQISAAGQLAAEQKPGLDGSAWGMVDAGSGRHRAPEGEVSARRHGAVDAGWWSVEPDVDRVAHGVPSRVDRLAALGNAVVPQIPELIGRAILASKDAA